MGKEKSSWFIDYNNDDAPCRIFLQKLSNEYNVAPRYQTYEEALDAAIKDVGKCLDHRLEEFKEKLLKLKADASLQDIDSINYTLKEIHWAFEQYQELFSNRLNDLMYSDEDDDEDPS